MDFCGTLFFKKWATLKCIPLFYTNIPAHCCPMQFFIVDKTLVVPNNIWHKIFLLDIIIDNMLHWPLRLWNINGTMTSTFWELKPEKLYTLRTLIFWNLKSVNAISMLKILRTPWTCAFFGLQKNEGPLVQKHHLCI